MAYWAGGHFLNYIENKKTNTIRCLIFENSSEIPFYLNDSFLSCTGSKAQDLFLEFKADYLKKYDDSVLVKENGENIFGPQDYQKGQIKIEDLLLQVERKKKISALVRYDLKDKVNTYKIFSDPIDHLAGVVKLEDDSTGILVAFNDDPHFSTHNRVWKIINPDTLSEEKTLFFAHDPSYVLSFEANNYISFTYQNNQWRAYQNEKLIREWPLKYNIVGVSKSGDQINLKINTAKIGTSTYTADKNLEKIEQDGKLADFSDTDEKPVTEIETYPKLYHMKPHYWFLATGNSTSPGSIGAMTSVNDPMTIHTLSLTGLLYPDVSKVGGHTQYTYTDHLWKSYLLLARDYSKNSWSENLNTATDAAVGTLYLFELQKWNYIPQFTFGGSDTTDAISTQNSTYWNLIQSVHYRALSINDFWQAFTTTMEWGATTQSSGDPYYKLQTSVNLTNNLSEDLFINFKIAYGKLYKNTFADGVLYGGGTSIGQLNRRFEFYGLPYGDAYGNEISSSRMTLDYNLWNIYHGTNLIPFYSKELHIFGGGESLSADRIYIDQIFYRDQTINSTFIGINLMTNIFYYVPTDIKVVASTTSTPSGRKLNFLNFFFSLEL